MSIVLQNEKPQKYRSIQDIMKDPAAKAKLTNLIDEAVSCKLAIQLQQETIKQLKETAKSDLMLDPKLFTYYASMMFNNDYTARKEHVSELENLINTVMLMLPADNSNYANYTADEE